MDEHTLLCEDCGYALSGLPLTGKCPECGRDVARSLPDARPGSPWQQSPSLRGWVRSNWCVLRRPRALFTALRIAPGSGRWLLLINLAIAAAFIVAPWTGTLIGDPSRGVRGEGVMSVSLTTAWVFVAQVGFVAAILFLLTAVEFLGIRFVAARRSWRLTRAGAWLICCHASIGWLVCGLAPMLGLAAMYSVQRLTGVTPTGTLDLSPWIAQRVSWYQVVGGGAIVLGYGLGLFVFEYLVYLGVRSCRYASTLPSERAASPAPRAP